MTSQISSIVVDQARGTANGGTRLRVLPARGIESVHNFSLLLKPFNLLRQSGLHVFGFVPVHFRPPRPERTPDVPPATDPVPSGRLILSTAPLTCSLLGCPNQAFPVLEGARSPVFVGSLGWDFWNVTYPISFSFIYKTRQQVKC